MLWLTLHTLLQLTPTVTRRFALGSFYRRGNQGSQLFDLFKVELPMANRTQYTHATLRVWALVALRM